MSIIRPAVLAASASIALAIYVLLYAPEDLRGTAGIPLLLAIWIFIQYPPPGDGVGQKAGALPGLKFLGTDKKTPLGEATGKKTVPLDAANMPLAGHAYLIVFFSSRRAVLKALRTRCDGMVRVLPTEEWFHAVYVSREDDLEALANVAKYWPNRPAALAHDQSELASANYISRWRAYAQPHAFLVGVDGLIVWHGQVNRSGLTEGVRHILLEHEAEGSKQHGGKTKGGAGSKAKKA